MYNILTLSVHSQIHSEYHDVVRTSVTHKPWQLVGDIFVLTICPYNMTSQVLCVYLKNRLHFAVVCSVKDTWYDVIMWQEQKSGTDVLTIL